MVSERRPTWYGIRDNCLMGLIVAILGEGEMPVPPEIQGFLVGRVKLSEMLCKVGTWIHDADETRNSGHPNTQALAAVAASD